MTFAEFLKLRKGPVPYFGGMLTGAEIVQQVDAGNITISDFSDKAVNPNSYNISIGDHVSMYHGIEVIDMNDPSTYATIHTYPIDPEAGFTLRPGNLYLIPTKETIATNSFIPLITGRSSIGRLGITVHQEAGFGDIGYNGVWTLQVKVTYPTIIYPGMKFAQVYFMAPCGDTTIMYQGRYQGARTIVPSKWES